MYLLKKNHVLPITSLFITYFVTLSRRCGQGATRGHLIHINRITIVLSLLTPDEMVVNMAKKMDSVT